jgi:hypothetical protein
LCLDLIEVLAHLEVRRPGADARLIA